MINSTEIKKYILANSTDSSNQKGYVLYMANAIKKIEFFNNEETAIARIQGSRLYKTSVFILPNDKTIATCSCPYNYTGMCKHKVALLYYMAYKDSENTENIEALPVEFSTEMQANSDNKVKLRKINMSITTTQNDQRKSQNQLKLKKISANPKDEVEIINYQHLSKSSLKSISYHSKLNYNLTSISIAEITEGFLLFKYRDWYGAINNVKFWLKKEELYSTCNCNENSETLCPHQSIALLKILENYGKDFFEKIKPQKIKQLINETAKLYGFPSKGNYTKFFRIGVENNKLKVYPVGEALGLVPLTQSDKQKPTILKEEVNLLSLVKAEDNFDLGFVFVFDEFYDFDYFQLMPITGKLNKDKTKLISPIRSFDEYDSKKVQISESDEKLFQIGDLTEETLIQSYLKRHGSEYLNDIPAVNKLISKYYEKFIPEIKELLSSKKHIFSSSTPGNLASNLVKISIHKENVKVYFNLSESDLFYNLELAVNLGGKEIPITDENLIYHSPFILEYYSTFFFIENVSDDLLIAENIVDRVSVKSVKVNFAHFFENHLKPISKKHKINFKANSISIEEKLPKNMKKQLYISELGKFVLFKPYFLYNEESLINILEQGSIIEQKNNKIVETFRNDEAEKEYYNFINKLHPKFENQFNENFFHLEFNDFVANQWFLNAFDDLSKSDIEVFGLKDLKNFKYATSRAKISVNIESGQDWFDVNVQVSFGDEQISLKDIKKAIVKRENFVKLSDGKLGILPDEWLQKFEKYFRQGQIKNDNLKISKLRFSIIDELFDEQDYFEIYKEIAEKKARLKEFSTIKNIRTPQKLNGTLRDYQKSGFNWLNFLDEFNWGGILADDMGLGKTIQVLAFLLKKSAKSTKASLVILPTTLLFNWENELEKFAPSLKPFFYYGAARTKDTKEFKNYDLVLTTYGTMTRDVELLRKYKFNYIILDESQAIKNPGSQRFKAASLLKANNRLALTGTPIENNTFDLYAQMDFLNPGFLGTQKQFKENYSDEIDKNQNPVIASELQNLINPFILRRTKEQVATELPPKTEDFLFCEMETEQRKVYEAFKNKYRDLLLNKIEEDGLGKSKIYVLEGLMKLRQICDSPEILSDKENYGKESIKIKEIVNHIKEKTGKHKILIFSQFVKMLSVIKRELKKGKVNLEYLDGKSSQKARQASVEHFQSDEACRVFLISLKAGGTGLNLTAADYVYIVDPWWNPAVENQAIDRCYRIGQNKKVIAYRMICKNTIEEKIMKYQAKKQKIANDIISTDDGFVKKLEKADIEDLFS